MLKPKLKFKLTQAFGRQQPGDTLIEVTIATIIISVILFSAYNLGTKAFQLGQTARERTQAAQLLQSQMEGLRALRDHEAWNTFRAQVPANQNFHVTFAGNNWAVQADNTSTCSNGYGWDPSQDDSSLPACRYGIVLNGRFYNCNDTSCVPGTTEFKGQATITWDPLGSAPEPEKSVIYINLTDWNISVPG